MSHTTTSLAARVAVSIEKFDSEVVRYMCGRRELDALALRTLLDKDPETAASYTRKMGRKLQELATELVHAKVEPAMWEVRTNGQTPADPYYITWALSGVQAIQLIAEHTGVEAETLTANQAIGVKNIARVN